MSKTEHAKAILAKQGKKVVTITFKDVTMTDAEARQYEKDNPSEVAKVKMQLDALKKKHPAAFK